MQISIFPKAKALPESKEEKNTQAWFTSKPHLPEVVKVIDHEELIKIVCENAWSPSIFTAHRNQHNFKSTDFMVLDIDDGMTIQQAEKVVHKLDKACLCIPSTSHTDTDHRFRLIFPLSRSINNKPEFEETMLKLTELFPADPSCVGDTARFFFGGRLVDGFWYEADLLDPIVPEKPKKGDIKRYDHKSNVVVAQSIEELVEALYGEKRTKVPENISYFLEHAHTGLEGEMYIRGNSFLFTCGLMNLDEKRIKDVFYSLYPHEVTTKVEYMVDKIIQEGYDGREEL